MVTGVFGDNIKDLVRVIKGGKKKERVEFPMCSHPELIPTQWDQPRPEPARTIGGCPVHDYICPICGFGVSCAPSCDCPDKRSSWGD